MALDKAKLQAGLEAMFQAAFEQNFTRSQIAGELATLIHDYVKSAEVDGVQVDVKDASGVSIGTGIQTNSVQLT